MGSDELSDHGINVNTLSEDKETGLVCAYLLDGKGGGQELKWSEIKGAMQAKEVLWVHLDFTSPQACKWLLEDSSIDPSIVEAMLESDTRPRSIQYKNGILAMLRGVNCNPDSDAEDMVTLRIWLEKDFIVSIRRRRLLSVTDVRNDLDNGSGPKDVGQFLSQVSERMIDRIGEVVNQIADQLDTRELELQKDARAPERAQFSVIRRRSAHIRRYLAPQRDAFDRLSRMPRDILSDQDRMEMNESANQMTFFVEELDLARERAMLAQEEILNLLAHNQNSKMFLLAIVSAIFLPLSFLTGLFGMNVAGLPGLENAHAFNIVVGIMASVGVAILLIFWKNKWF